MNAKIRGLIAVAGFAVVSTAGIGTAIAGEDRLDENYWVTPVPEAWYEAYFDNDKDFYANRSFGRQLAWQFGFRFPDLEIEADGKSVNDFYNYMMDRQARSGPILRTPDLVNPFNSSLFTLPSAQVGSRRSPRGEFVFETLPPR